MLYVYYVFFIFLVENSVFIGQTVLKHPSIGSFQENKCNDIKNACSQPQNKENFAIRFFILRHKPIFNAQWHILYKPRNSGMICPQENHRFNQQKKR